MEQVLQARIQAIDNFTRPMREIIKQTKAFQSASKAVKPLVLKAKDMATKVMNKVRGGLNKFKGTKLGQITLTALDKATKIITTVATKVRGLAGKAFTLAINAKDGATKVIDSIKGKLGGLKSMAGGIVIGAVAGAGAGITKGVSGLGEEQTQKITISNVVENTGKTKEDAKKITDTYYKELEKFANATPFTNSEVAGFGVKAMQMAKGNADKAMEYTKAQGSVKALVGDMRTGQEVSEAFFSAANGNMDSINNILGENYKNFDDLIKGVNTKQKDVLADMSTTIPGLLSTIGGKVGAGLKNFMKAFAEPLSNMFNGVVTLIDDVSGKMEGFGQKIANVMTGNAGEMGFGIEDSLAWLIGSIPEAIASLGDLVNKFFDFGVIKSIIAPVIDLFNFFMEDIVYQGDTTTGVIKVLGEAFNIVGGLIVTAIEWVSPIIKDIFTFIGEKTPQLSKIVEALGIVFKLVCNVLGMALQGAWIIIEPILDVFIDVLAELGQWIKNIGDWWNNMVKKIKENPVVATVTNIVDTVTGKKKDSGKKSAFGTKRVVGDDVPFRLHDGERVLTRQEADRMDRNSTNGIIINMNGVTIREEADINKVATKLLRKINEQRPNLIRG